MVGSRSLFLFTAAFWSFGDFSWLLLEIGEKKNILCLLPAILQEDFCKRWLKLMDFFALSLFSKLSPFSASYQVDPTAQISFESHNRSAMLGKDTHPHD